MARILRRHPETLAILATRVFLSPSSSLSTGHAGRSLLVIHIPAAIAVVGIAVRQATGFVLVPNLTSVQRRELTSAPARHHSDNLR